MERTIKFPINCFLTAGPLCLSKHRDNQDRRLDDNFPSFKKFNRTLITTCEQGDPGILEITPNTSWPDTVYYNSFTQANMGWKIHIVDNFVRSKGNQLEMNTSIVISMITVVFVKQFIQMFV